MKKLLIIIYYIYSCGIEKIHLGAKIHGLGLGLVLDRESCPEMKFNYPSIEIMNDSISVGHLQTRLAFLLVMDVSSQSPLVKGKILEIKL